MPTLSPLASGDVFGLRVAANGSTNWGQGAEIGKGRWVAVDTAPAPASSTRPATSSCAPRRCLQKFTGYYRPEDMDIDPLAAERRRVPRLLGQHRPAELRRRHHRRELGRPRRGHVHRRRGRARPRRPARIPVVTRFIAGNQQIGHARQRRLPAAHGQPRRARRRPDQHHDADGRPSLAATTSGSACRTATTTTRSPTAACGSPR